MGIVAWLLVVLAYVVVAIWIAVYAAARITDARATR